MPKLKKKEDVKFEKKNTFYVTTTIPYANAAPHIGFALEIVQADAIARWNRLLGKDVFFLTGTDEHGSKNYKMAKEVGLTPQQFVDKNSSYYKELTKSLNISNTNFIRTTDKEKHWPGVFKIWKTLAEKGDIYKKSYEGYYCYGCERFVTEKDLINGKCPDHPNLTPELITEENYFFKLTKYSSKIKELIVKDELKIFPQKWKNDFLSLIKEGLTDVSFSRDKKHLPWGIPVPGDENQVMYVWADALANYLTGIGYPDDKYKKYWPADVHVVGKDMLRFHTGIWPGMLLSANIPLPKEVIVHGFLTVNGQKMSKSLGNVTSPLELAKKYNVDGIRYYLLRTIPFGEDGDFSEIALIDRYNNELANKLGNLVSRTTTLAEANGLEKCENKLLKKLKLEKIKELINNYEFDKALILIFEFTDECNNYIQQNEIWKSKDKKKLYELVDSIKAVSILLYPFIPGSCEKIASLLNFKITSLEQIQKPLEIKPIKKAEVLFKKIETENIKANNPIKKESAKMPEQKSNIVEFSEFTKLDIRIGTITEAKPHPNADKLFILKVDFGNETRQIVAGLRKFYTDHELVGKQISVIMNLKPAVLRGIESQGMLLAAEDSEGKVVLMIPEKKVLDDAKIS